MQNKIFAYIRVSTKEQNEGRQLKAINDYCSANNLQLDEHDIFLDKQSGKDFNRPKYQMLKYVLRKGDTLIIKELDRLGRNMNMIKDEWQELSKVGINIIVIDTPILNTQNKTDLEKNLISNIVFELLSYMAEKERLKIRQRQAEGIALMKATGKTKSGKAWGRPRVEYPSNWDNVYQQWKNGGITATRAMELLNLKRNTFYKLANEYNRQNN
jgi:DNA invertase Pin-like site-specific DNA recombinase